MRLRRSSKFNSAKAQFKRFKVQNATAPQFKVLSPLSYESGRAERKWFNVLWTVQIVQCTYGAVR